MNDARSPVPVSTIGRLGSFVRAAAGAASAACIAGIALLSTFAWLLPQPFGSADDGSVRLLAVAFFTRVFQFHLGLLVVSAVLVAFGARWRRTACVGLIVAASLLMPYAREYVPRRPPPPAGATFRVMAINLFFTNRDEAAIVAAIDAADADVIVMPEITSWSWRNVIEKHLAGRYTVAERSPGDGAALILTRLPFRLGEATDPTTDVEHARRPVIVDVGGAEVSVYGVHLVSPGRWWLVGYNRVQTALLAKIARDEQRPVLIAGDFNFAPLTPNAYELRRAGLRTSHELAGRGLGNTWGPRWWPSLNRLPGVRIDHIYLSKGLTATHHSVGPDTGSDHRPVVADVALTR